MHYLNNIGNNIENFCKVDNARGGEYLLIQVKITIIYYENTSILISYLMT